MHFNRKTFLSKSSFCKGLLKFIKKPRLFFIESLFNPLIEGLIFRDKPRIFRGIFQFRLVPRFIDLRNFSEFPYSLKKSERL